MSTYGYAGKILKVDLSSRTTTEIPTMDYADFIGGWGMAAKIYWDEVPPESDAFDPQNMLIFATGPLCGLPKLSGSRWVVCGKSAATTPEKFSFCNMGGTWGAELKFAGYDAMTVTGKSPTPVYLFIRAGTTEFIDASVFWGKCCIETRDELKTHLGESVKVLTIGPAGENRVIRATLQAEHDAAGAGGLAAVMGSKNLKAIVVKGEKQKVQVARPEKLQELTDFFMSLAKKSVYVGAAPHRSSQDLLVDFAEFPAPPGIEKQQKEYRCYGCARGCQRLLWKAADGKTGKFTCDSAHYYQSRAEAYYGEWNDVPFYAARLLNDYGMDCGYIDHLVSWIDACHKAGIMTDDNTGIPVSKVGSLEFIETLIRKVSLREGIGDVLSQGLDKAADAWGPAAKEQLKNVGHIHRPGYYNFYSPRLYIITGIFYAMEPRMPIMQLHEVVVPIAKWYAWANRLPGNGLSSDNLRAFAARWWGSEKAVDFRTYEGKALAAKCIQDRQYAKECLVLCDRPWPVFNNSDNPDLVGDPSLESQIVSAVIGKDIDEQGLYRVGERVLNLRRAILTREGHRGRQFDVLPEEEYTVPLGEYENLNYRCLLPGKRNTIISRKGDVVDRQEFEKMKSEYYELRRWDVDTGLQTRTTLEELGLSDIADDLEQRGLAV